MRSEQQHIDDFFRKKEEAHQPDTGNMDGNWEQMKGLLKPSGDPTPKNFRLQTTRRIIKYLGGFTVVTVITLIWLNTSRTAKKQPAAKAVAQKAAAAAPASKQPATHKPAVTQTSRPTAKAVIKKTNTPPATQKPAYHGTYTTPPVSPQLAIADNVTAEKAPQEVKPEIVLVENKGPETTPDSARAAQQLEAFYKALQKPAQQFVINTSKDTTLIGREGTRLTIPAQAFATHKKGTIYGNVQIVLREYYSYEDILAAKLTTTSGDIQLESGGMVQISANVDGEEAGLKTGKRIKLEMPTTSYNEEMQLFSGVRTSIKPAFHATFMNNTMIDTVHFLKRQKDENGSVDWTPEGQVQKLSFRENRKIKLFRMYNDPYKLVHGKKTKAYFYIAPECPLSDKEMKVKLKEHANGYYDLVKVKRLKPKHRSDALYTDVDEPVVGDSLEMSFGQALRLKLLSPEDSLRAVAQLQKDSASQEDRRKQMSRYSFSVGNLGWFNCDRFSNDRGPKVLFTFNPGEGYEASAMVSHLVFTRYRSVLPGKYVDRKIDFGRIPKDEPVKLVSIGIKNGRVMACIQSLNATGAAISNLAFEETTPEQFKQKLQALNISLP